MYGSIFKTRHTNINTNVSEQSLQVDYFNGVNVLYIKKFPNISDISLHMGVRIGGWGCTIIPNTQYQKQNCTGRGDTNIANIEN